ncbi:FAD-binding protein [Afifella sp. IM 167]|uniref:FAD-binding protein n=1 Tax=Afifella sp. IM 167 TaxID=2033586 RepID=UPI001CCAB875|nr:FAD-binding protein [Afifella sp. IM 167]MBZ8133507.1 2-hydroxy-acid oxidase [Afifella sp. IM 167]
MAERLRPETDAGLLDVVAWAAAEEVPLEILGHGSKRGIGRPVQAEYTLDVSGLAGVTLYEPDELVLSAKAGTPLSEVEKLLRDANQELAFEPIDYAPLFGGEAGSGTLGGVYAANLAGPRRIKAGAARDHVLGLAAVSGRGEAFKSGGRVVKNVTGYDLSKGLAGSWGTLAVVTDLTFKVLPRAERVATVLVKGLSDEAAGQAMCATMGSALEVSGAAHLPAETVADFGLGSDAVTALRLEGFPTSVAYRSAALKKLTEPQGPVEVLDVPASEDLWKKIRDAAPFQGEERPLWRISVAPRAGAALMGALASEPETGRLRWFYDWSGGLVWLSVEDDIEDAGAMKIRSALAASGGGHATLVRGPAALRTGVSPFQPQPEALAALSKRLKESFDPRGILNPGRMGA